MLSYNDPNAPCPTCETCEADNQVADQRCDCGTPLCECCAIPVICLDTQEESVSCVHCVTDSSGEGLWAVQWGKLERDQIADLKAEARKLRLAA